MSENDFVGILLRKVEVHSLAIKGMRAAPAYFSDDVFGFHIQQQIELLLKAWLALLGEQYPLTHDIEKLLGILQSRNVQAESLKDLGQYTPYSVQFRYGEHPAYALDRDAAVRHVEALHDQVRSLLKDENDRAR